MREGLIELLWRQAVSAGAAAKLEKYNLPPSDSNVQWMAYPWERCPLWPMPGDSAFKRGRVAARKIGRVWKFSKKEVDEWVKSDKANDNEPGSKGDR